MNKYVNKYVILHKLEEKKEGGRKEGRKEGLKSQISHTDHIMTAEHPLDFSARGVDHGDSQSSGLQPDLRKLRVKETRNKEQVLFVCIWFYFVFC